MDIIVTNLPCRKYAVLCTLSGSFEVSYHEAILDFLNEFLLIKLLDSSDVMQLNLKCQSHRKR